MKILVLVFSLCFLAFLSLNSAQAASTGDVFINEVAWMGTETSANDEWIELYNNTDLPIDLSGWVLKGVSLTGMIPARGFYLLERTNDQTVPNVSADQIYTGALNNQGVDLELDDSAGELIDLVNSEGGWLAGDNTTKQTMERKDANAWQTSQNPGGTPKAKNSREEVLTKADALEARPFSDNGLAAIGEPIRRFPFLMALAMAVFSVVIILVLKNKVKIG